MAGRPRDRSGPAPDRVADRAGVTVEGLARPARGPGRAFAGGRRRDRRRGQRQGRGVHRDPVQGARANGGGEGGNHHWRRRQPLHCRDREPGMGITPHLPETTLVESSGGRRGRIRRQEIPRKSGTSHAQWRQAPSGARAAAGGDRVWYGQDRRHGRGGLPYHPPYRADEEGAANEQIDYRSSERVLYGSRAAGPDRGGRRRVRGSPPCRPAGSRAPPRRHGWRPRKP